ncbi:Heterodisulfide reductase, cytochrome reductase subunit [Labilithrix luteola]|uniref:Heterodisulfide reductase, cytochrome reductase subunit n=1 Tax=Labilithrix luteola TaxID=1391654 RepID=A0A0K1PU03_9BACT|nr:hypothetical protein [Labilithrix luteola]AKU96841.1 Heterodisulfide reductase, cytochrome reductase subunit [Labilithrix luteola]
MVVQSNATLAARRDAGADMLLVGIEVAGELADGYVAPGQYVEVDTGRGKGYFVLAGGVGESRWELLVRNAGDAADALHLLPLGSALRVSMPLGHGFPLSNARGRPLVVAVVGSALAVARPVMRFRIESGDARTTHLFMGVRAARDVPLSDEVSAWREAGVNEVLCLSRTELDHDRAVLPGAIRAEGYVQQELERAIDTLRVPAGALVVAAGPEAMLAELRSFGAARHREIEVITNV